MTIGSLLLDMPISSKAGFLFSPLPFLSPFLSINSICHIYLQSYFSVSCKLFNSFRAFEGLSDDDLRETAYEVLVASVAFSG